jgi:anaerobic ribonucleoside-triphosphate reductase
MVPSTLKSAIIDRLKFAKQIQPESNHPNVIIIGSEHESESEQGLIDLKRKIKDILIQSNIRDFVAITDPIDHQKILIAGKKDAERLDSFHCPHCGMEFIDEIQLGIHQRLHLPF